MALDILRVLLNIILLNIQTQTRSLYVTTSLRPTTIINLMLSE